MYENRSDRADDARENRNDRVDNTQQQRTDRQANTQQQRTDRQQNRTSASPSATTGTASAESRGYSRDGGNVDRSGTRSDAFSGYSSGKSERSASQRGTSSRSSSRSSGSRRR
jgi:hypothetical protein